MIHRHPASDAGLSPLGRLLAKVKRRATLSHLVPSIAHEAAKLERQMRALDWRLRRMHRALGRVEARLSDGAATLQEAEFQVFSQWGEDGAIRWLTRHVPIPSKRFVEFGAESYEEANTRFLLTDAGWAGLVLDGDEGNIAQVRADDIYWLHNLKAEAAFITAENIDELLRRHGMTGDIGLLSIDIDGMDYHVWKALTVATPRIVVIEYNALFGPERAVTVPYQPDFDRRKAHHSICYYGASLAAMSVLGESKGYDLVGCGKAGLNAYFVRRDVRPESVPTLAPAEAYIAGDFCEYHDPAGVRVRKSNHELSRLLASLPLQDV